MNAVKNKGVDCFVAYAGAESTLVTLKQLSEEPLVKKIYVLMNTDEPFPFKGCEAIRVNNFTSSQTIRAIAAKVESPYVLMCRKDGPITFGYNAIERMVSVAVSVDSASIPTALSSRTGNPSITPPWTSITAVCAMTSISAPSTCSMLSR